MLSVDRSVEVISVIKRNLHIHVAYKKQLLTSRWA